MVKAVDQSSGATETILVSASGSLYSDIKAGSWVYLDSSTPKYYNGTPYRVAQLYSSNQTVISNDVLTNTLWNTTRRVQSTTFRGSSSYSYLNVVDYGTPSYQVTGKDVMFMNVRVTVTVTTTGTGSSQNVEQKVTAVEQVADTWGMDSWIPTADKAASIGAISNSNSFSVKSKAYDWSGFSTNMRQPTASDTWNGRRVSQTVSGTLTHPLAPTTLAGWYVVPNTAITNNLANNQGFIVVYVSEVITINVIN